MLVSEKTAILEPFTLRLDLLSLLMLPALNGKIESGTKDNKIANKGMFAQLEFRHHNHTHSQTHYLLKSVKKLCLGSKRGIG